MPALNTQILGLIFLMPSTPVSWTPNEMPMLRQKSKAYAWKIIMWMNTSNASELWHTKPTITWGKSRSSWSSLKDFPIASQKNASDPLNQLILLDWFNMPKILRHYMQIWTNYMGLRTVKGVKTRPGTLAIGATITNATRCKATGKAGTKSIKATKELTRVVLMPNNTTHPTPHITLITPPLQWILVWEETKSTVNGTLAPILGHKLMWPTRVVPSKGNASIATRKATLQRTAPPLNVCE